MYFSDLIQCHNGLGYFRPVLVSAKNKPFFPNHLPTAISSVQNRRIRTRQPSFSGLIHRSGKQKTDLDKNIQHTVNVIFKTKKR